MCNLSEGVWERGEQKGMQKGMQQQDLEHIVNLMQNTAYPFETVVRLLGIPAEKWTLYKSLLEKRG